MLSNYGTQGANNRVNMVPFLQEVRCRDSTPGTRLGGSPLKDTDYTQRWESTGGKNETKPRDKEYMGASVMISEKMILDSQKR